MSEENQRVDVLVEKLQERIEKSEVENATQIEVIAKGADQIIASQREVIDNLTKSLGELKEEFSVLFENVKPLFETFAKSVDNLVNESDVNEKIEKALTDVVEPLNKELAEVKETNETLNNENEELVKNLDEVKVEKEELTKSVEDLNVEKEELVEAKDELVKKVEELEAEPVVKSAQVEADLNPQEEVEEELSREDVIKSLITEITNPSTPFARKAEIRKNISRLEAGVSLASIKL